MPGAGISMGRMASALIGPLSSSGLPSASTTRPTSASPTGTDTTLPVRLTSAPSLRSRNWPRMTAPTVLSSRLKASPLEPFSNSSISPAMQLASP